MLRIAKELTEPHAINLFKIFGCMCKYNKVCELYDLKSPTCNTNGGDYYGPGRKCGKYRENVN